MSLSSTCILLHCRTKPPRAEYPLSRPCVELAPTHGYSTRRGFVLPQSRIQVESYDISQVSFEEGIKQTYLILSHFFRVPNLLKSERPRRMDFVYDTHIYNKKNKFLNVTKSMSYQSNDGAATKAIMCVYGALLIKSVNHHGNCVLMVHRAALYNLYSMKDFHLLKEDITVR